MRQPVLAALCLLVAQSFSTAARADIEVRVTPDHVRQCRPAHFFASINNDSSEPMEVDVTASLTHGNRSARMFLGHFAIAAGASHVEEFDFVMPRIGLGRYVVTLHAALADQSSMEGSARFTISTTSKATDCPQGVAPQDLLSILANNLAAQLAGGVTIRPDAPQYDAKSSATSSTSATTWQTAKMLYR